MDHHLCQQSGNLYMHPSWMVGPNRGRQAFGTPVRRDDGSGSGPAHDAGGPFAGTDGPCARAEVTGANRRFSWHWQGTRDGRGMLRHPCDFPITWPLAVAAPAEPTSAVLQCNATQRKGRRWRARGRRVQELAAGHTGRIACHKS